MSNLEAYRQAIDGMNYYHTLFLPCHYEMRTYEVVIGTSVDAYNLLYNVYGHLSSSYHHKDDFFHDYDERPQVEYKILDLKCDILSYNVTSKGYHAFIYIATVITTYLFHSLKFKLG